MCLDTHHEEHHDSHHEDHHEDHHDTHHDAADHGHEHEHDTHAAHVDVIDHVDLHHDAHHDAHHEAAHHEAAHHDEHHDHNTIHDSHNPLHIDHKESKVLSIGTAHPKLGDAKKNAHSANKPVISKIHPVIHSLDIHPDMHTDHNAHTTHDHDSNLIPIHSVPITMHGHLGPEHAHDEAHHDHLNLQPRHDFGFMGHDDAHDPHVVSQKVREGPGFKEIEIHADGPISPHFIQEMMH